MSRPTAETMRAVEERAAGRCEYCLMHQALQGATFHVEPIRPRSRGGSSDLDNLAWCCPGCNLRKADRIGARDAETGEDVPLFHPRREDWSEHFRWKGQVLVGRSPTGRATINALDLNQARRVQIRRAEGLFGLFPP